MARRLPLGRVAWAHTVAHIGWAAAFAVTCAISPIVPVAVALIAAGLLYAQGKSDG